MSTEVAAPEAAPAAGHVRLDLEHYRQVSHALESTQSEIERLEHSEAFEVFQKQLSLLRRRLLNSPQSLRQTFVDDGVQAIVWEFSQDALGASFTKMLWSLLLRSDDMATILQRFLWAMPLKFKRKFIVAIDAHLSDRYPMFKGLSVNWPSGNFIHPYVRPAEVRKNDFELVTTGYLGYRALGYSLREVDLFVWLEVLRDKQCEDRPCEQGVFAAKSQEGRLPGRHPYSRHAQPDGPGQTQGSPRPHPGEQPAAGRHRPRLPAGASVPGRLHHRRSADRDRPARMVPARARAPRPARGRHSVQRRRRLRHAVGTRRQTADRCGRLRARRPDQRLSAVGRGLSSHGVRGVP